jgi:hypothetical protein
MVYANIINLKENSMKKAKDTCYRTYSITEVKNSEKYPYGLYDAKMVDSYGRHAQCYFNTYALAASWVYYMWENEDFYNSSSEDDSLNKAIQNCIELDNKAGRENGGLSVNK